MKLGFIRSLCALAAALSIAPGASASVLTFEDLDGFDFFGATYRGFNFGNNDRSTNDWFYSDGVSPFYTPRSGTHYVATDYTLYPDNAPLAAASPITSATAFLFNGAWFSGDGAIAYALYRGGMLVFTSAPSAALDSTPLFVASGYGGLVDQVVVRGHQGFYVLDDFTYNVTAAAVPEPDSIALLAIAGLAAMVVRRRRMR